MTTQPSENSVVIAAFYLFTPLPDFEELQLPLQQRCEALGLLGTILLASEGVNGTVSGSADAIEKLMSYMKTDVRLSALKWKSSVAEAQPFHRMKVRLKREIVSLGVPGIDPLNAVGEYVPPEQWNALIARPEVRVVDTRNDYECHLGSFEEAEDPGTRSFREFPEWAERHLDPERDEHVAMFCTGGIRCEKATAYLKDKGFKNVYHLEGGILNYLANIPEEQSRWQGECFVFDNRVSVDHDLQPGDRQVCPACRMPLAQDDYESPQFELHVSCPRCFDRLTPEKRERLLERAKQMELAAARGERHLGRR